MFYNVTQTRVWKLKPDMTSEYIEIQNQIFFLHEYEHCPGLSYKIILRDIHTNLTCISCASVINCNYIINSIKSNYYSYIG